MTASEKVAYLKGLAEGLDIDKKSKEGKLFAAIIDTLEELAGDIADLESNAWDLGEAIDQVSDDLRTSKTTSTTTMKMRTTRTRTGTTMTASAAAAATSRCSTRSPARPAAIPSPSTRMCSTWAPSSAPTAARPLSSTASPPTTKSSRKRTRTANNAAPRTKKPRSKSSAAFLHISARCTARAHGLTADGGSYAASRCSMDSAAASMEYIGIPYPRAGSFTRTWVRC